MPFFGAFGAAWDDAMVARWSANPPWDALAGDRCVDVTPGDYFELVARQTSASTKNVAADELTWIAIEVVE